MSARLGMLMLALATSTPSQAAKHADRLSIPAESIVHKVGLCRVRSKISPVPGPTRMRSFLVEVGAKRVVVAPAAGVDWMAKDRTTRVDAVLLNSLSEVSLSGMVVGGTVNYPDSRIFVDRSLLEAAKTSLDRSSRGNLDAVIASGRLYSPEANVDLLPGVRFTITPHGSISSSRVKIRCGDKTLIILDGDELASSGFNGVSPVAFNRSDRAHLTSLAGDRATLAITSGLFPALASIYRHADGFRLGPIEAKEYGGAAPPRGQVIVEDAPSP